MSKEEKKVTGLADMWIEFTEKDPYHKKGQREAVHALVAEKLIAKGFAVKAKPAKEE